MLTRRTFVSSALAGAALARSNVMRFVWAAPCSRRATILSNLRVSTNGSAIARRIVRKQPWKMATVCEPS